MCQLLETIKVENGVVQNIGLHNERMNIARYELFGLSDTVSLQDYIKIPDEYSRGTVRCRVVYDSVIHSVCFSIYEPAAVKTLRLAEGDSVCYSYKFLDRSALNNLIDRNIADDILIVRDGFLTDASFANIVFTDGKKWITPDTPLLRGTMRELLIRKGIITASKMTVADISSFTHFRLINAMLGFTSPLLPVENIIK